MDVKSYYDPVLETMPPADRQRYADQRLRRIVRFAYEYAPAMKEKLDKARVNPESVLTARHLESIPITRKEDLPKLQRLAPPFGGFVTVPPSTLEWIVVNPGPLYVPSHTEECYQSTAKALYAGGFRSGDLVVNTFGYNYHAAWLITEGLRRLAVTIVPTGVGNTEFQVQVMRDLGATGFLGTPSFLNNIIKKAQEMGLDVRRDFRLRVAMIGGEPAPPSLKKSFQDDYGISTPDLYGNTEVGTLGFECELKTGFHVPDEIFVEVVDPATGQNVGPGQVGEVVVTPFFEIYPILRLGTGDLSAYTDEICACGRTSRRLLGIRGRVGDAVRVRALFIFPHQLQAVVARLPEVGRYQLVVSRINQRDFVTLKVELQKPAEQAQLAAALSQGFQDACGLKMDKVDFVAAGAIPAGAKALVDERKWE